MRPLFLLSLVMLVSSSIVASKSGELESRFKDFYLRGEMVLWQQLVDSLRNSNLDFETERELLFAEYGLIGNYLGTNNYDAARSQLPFFEKRIASLIAKYPKNGELYAFSAASVGYNIALQPLRAPFLSRNHTDNIRKALELSPNNGMPLVEQANSLYFRPTLVGGNKNASVAYYERAFSYFRIHRPNHWMYYNVGAWLGQVYANMGDKKKAYQMYSLLLKQAPNFKWVKDDLLPGLNAN
jgi:tetratricopeptide (TPR) repeat protein